MRLRKEFKPFFTTGLENEVIARVYQEERSGVGIRERVVHASGYGKSRIETDKWEYNKHSEAEKTATVHSFDLINEGYNLVVWISPKSDIYEEGRLNVNLSMDGGKTLDPWGVPLLMDENESMELAKRLLKEGGVSMDPIYSPEDLRKQPMGFRLEDQEKWLEKMRQLVPELDEIWQEIESGQVESRMGEISKAVERAKIRSGGNNLLFEMEMLRVGYRLNVSGVHGGSWMSRLANLGIFNYKIEMFGANFYTKPVERKGKMVCPVCGEEVGRGKNSCPSCGVKLK